MTNYVIKDEFYIDDKYFVVKQGGTYHYSRDIKKAHKFATEDAALDVIKYGIANTFHYDDAADCLFVVSV
jgi:hypothetical protein